jgi:hypothetical protein
MNVTRGLYERRREIAGAIVVLALRIATMPRTFWENDELLFAAAIRDFDPWKSHPHPPGYPLLVGLGKLFDFVLGDPFRSLVALSILGSVVAFVFLSLTFRRILGDADLAFCGALLWSCSATMVLHGPLPLSDAPAMMFVALSLYAATFFPHEATERTAIGFGLAVSAAIGTRPQLAVPLLPLFLLLIFWTRDRRRIVAALIAFTLLSIGWFAPLMDAAGGFDKLLLWETRQAAYVASHDAQLSRGASSAGMLVTRFLFHPWGPKFIALPLSLLAIIGAWSLRRRPRHLVLPIAFFGIVYFIFEVWTMDPADAPRYSIPLLAVVALLIAASLDSIRESARMPNAPYIVAGLASLVSVMYVGPIIADRTRGPSPPAAAAAYANAHFTPNTIVLTELSLRPHAEYLIARTSMPVEMGLQQFYDRPDVPLVLFADGGAPSPAAKVFSWRDSDAYGKLTRNHYRRVALEPVAPNERYLPLRGVHPFERTVEGDEWRWLAPDAALRLPARHGAKLVSSFRLSPDAPYETNAIHVLVNGREAGTIVATKTAAAITVALPPGPCDVTIRSERSFRPADVLHNRDPRVLSVQLLALRTE